MSAGDQGGVIWFTGIPASGKTTVAHHVRDALRARGVPVVWLDSDDMRTVATPEPTYTADERDRFYRLLGHVARLAAEGGAVGLVSATAPRRAHRDEVRRVVRHFVEVWVRCDPATARARDPKGLYARAERGEITTLPGAGAPFEEPRQPELILDTAAETPEALAAHVLAYVAREVPVARATPRGAPARPGASPVLPATEQGGTT